MQMPGGGNSGHLHGCNVTVEAYCKWTQGWLAWLKKPTCCLWTAVVFAETAPVRKVRILPLFVYCQVRESVTVPAGRALFRMTLILNSAMSMIPKVMQNQWQLVHSIFPPGMPRLNMRPCSYLQILVTDNCKILRKSDSYLSSTVHPGSCAPVGWVAPDCAHGGTPTLVPTSWHTTHTQRSTYVLITLGPLWFTPLVTATTWWNGWGTLGASESMWYFTNFKINQWKDVFRLSIPLDGFLMLRSITCEQPVPVASTHLPQWRCCGGWEGCWFYHSDRTLFNNA